MDTVDIDGLRIAFNRAGRGPSLVFLGGFVGSGTATWHHQIAALAGTHTVVAWDAPGSGESSDVPESYRLPDYSDRLAALVSELGLDTAIFVGLSFGGALALEHFARHRDQVRGLFLAGAYSGWAGSLAPETVESRLRMSIEASRLAPAAFVSTLLPSMFSATVPAAVVDAFAADIASSYRPAGFRAMARASAAADLRAVLPTIDVPTTILCGDHDVRAPLPVAEALHAAIPGSSLVVLTGVGHVSCLEAPEPFTAELRAFLELRG